MAENPASSPLCIQSQRPYRNGWQLVCCTAEPLVARMCASTTPERTCPASSRRFRSLHAGSMLRNTPGVGEWSSYQPTPTPSPLVASAPSRLCRLCMTSELVGL